MRVGIWVLGDVCVCIGGLEAFGGELILRGGCLRVVVLLGWVGFDVVWVRSL